MAVYYIHPEYGDKFLVIHTRGETEFTGKGIYKTVLLDRFQTGGRRSLLSGIHAGIFISFRKTA
jgi:hypothetical protein